MDRYKDRCTSHTTSNIYSSFTVIFIWLFKFDPLFFAYTYLIFTVVEKLLGYFSSVSKASVFANASLNWFKYKHFLCILKLFKELFYIAVCKDKAFFWTSEVFNCLSPGREMAPE